MTTETLARPDPFVPAVARVAAVRRELPDVWTLRLAAESAPFAPFAPGQFNMLTVFGVGEAAISISGDPARPFELIHTVRAVGAVSSAITRLKSGDSLGLRGPFGSAWPVADAEGSDLVFIAGGLGLAPLRPAIYHVLANRPRYGKVVLLYGSRSPADILYRHEVEEWRRRLDLSIEVTVDHAVGDWRGHVGVAPALLPRASFDPMHTVAFICGPEVMMRASAAALLAAGVEGSSIHLSMERNMKCAIGLCGHCQFGPTFVCKDGPVFSHDRIGGLLAVREI